MKLYRVVTKELGEYYVVARNPDVAYRVVRAWLDEKDYGFWPKRELESVHLIAEAGKEYPDCGMRLFLPAEAKPSGEGGEDE